MDPIDVGISASASSGAESGGPFSGGGDIVFNDGSNENDAGLDDTTGSDNLNPTSTASATAGGGTATAASGGDASAGGGGMSTGTLLLIAGAAVAAILIFWKHK